MKFPWTRKQEPEQPTTMLGCLDSDRPDLNVSLWLQDAFERYPQLPLEIEIAYLADRFVSEINSGGGEGVLSWERDNVSKMPSALSAIGMNDFASKVGQIVQDSKSGQFDSDAPEIEAFEQLVMSQSREIEKATHQYIRRNLDKFV